VDMADFAFIAAAIAFFGLCVAYVRGLDRIVRTAEDAEEEVQAEVQEPLTS
jgi:hypothetical protein